MPYSRKRTLSGRALEMMTPGIEFGPEATIEVFERMRAVASEMQPDTLLLGQLTAAQIVQAIDEYLPVRDGKRQISDKLNFDTLIEDKYDQKPAWVFATIQNEVWMKFDDEMPSFLGATPKEIWLAIQHLEYVGSYEPVEPAPEEITVDGKNFASQGRQVKIHSLAGKPMGELFELISTSAVLPQYYARMEDGQLRDLRNENYSVYEPEEEVAEVDDTPSPG